MSSQDDELARTATAPGTPPTIAKVTEPAPTTLGRYKLERELGAGGMGVVYAAFDPDLERRVAVKVLRSTAGGDASRQRLLREARAMARLTHPNVITVHEVGSTGGQDFVAMELIDGETLAEWLRSAKRPEGAVIDAFVAAGKGLAAAHAASIVHRDFKPHNVLRSKGGRVVVTDFGLARAADAPAADPMAATQDLASALGSGSGSLGELTATGSLLGTPAYMAPEQWRGDVSTASDQFAYCVALWEALAGKRPFQGSTIDELRAAIEAGPAKLDASAIPRRLRPILIRGLAPAPAQRFASMDALLAAMRRAERRPAVAYAVGGAVLAVGAVIGVTALLLARGPEPVGDTCPVPALDPTVVWSARRDAALGPHKVVRSMLAKDHATWLAVRTDICSLPSQLRGERLACLDAVASYQDMIAGIGETLPATAYYAASTALLVDPALCNTARPPRLLPATTELRAVITAAVPTSDHEDARSPAQVKRIVDFAGSDPCALAWAYLVAVEGQGALERARMLDLAEQTSLRCEDEFVKAIVATELARAAVSGWLPTGQSRMRTAIAAIERVKQSDLQGQIDIMRSELAMRDRNYDAALTAMESARAKFAARGRTTAEVASVFGLAGIYGARGQPGDLQKVDQLMADLRPRVIAAFGEQSEQLRDINSIAARRVFSTGDVQTAHELFTALWRARPVKKPMRITGRVLDAQGTPVANAKVYGAEGGAGSSVAALELLPGQAHGIRWTVTGADGTFVLDEGSVDGIVIAESGDRRSNAVTSAATVELTLAPTSRIEGTVLVDGKPAEGYALLFGLADRVLSPYRLVAPVRPDGTFTLSGAPRGKLTATVIHNDPLQGMVHVVDVVVNAPVVTGIEIRVQKTERTLAFLLRSTVNAPLSNAQVFVIPGGPVPKTIIDLIERPTGRAVGVGRPVDENTSAAIRSLAKRGDLVATVTNVAANLTQACAIPLPDDLDDDTLSTRVIEHAAQVPLVCVPLAANQTTTVIEVPPWPRLD